MSVCVCMCEFVCVGVGVWLKSWIGRGVCVWVCVIVNKKWMKEEGWSAKDQYQLLSPFSITLLISAQY